MVIEEVGTIEALLDSIKTMKDGSCKISFEVNPENIQVVNRLLNKYLINQRLFTIAIVQKTDDDTTWGETNSEVSINGVG